MSSILDRYDAMLLPFDTELRGQIHALAAGLPFAPTQPQQVTQGQGQEQGGAEARSNVPLTLLSFQHYIAPYIQQMVLLGDLVHRAAPRLYDDDGGRDGASATAGADEPTAAAMSAASAAPTSASLLSLLHSSLELHSLLCTESLSALLFCLFLAALLPYLEYLDEFTSRGVVSPRAREDLFFVRTQWRRRRGGAAVADGQGPTHGGDGTDDDESADDDDDGDDEQQRGMGRRRASRAVQADASDSLVLRLGPDGQPFAPSFLQPYAAHILLTGRSRAMVQAIRRAQSHSQFAEHGHDEHGDDAEEEGDAAPLFAEFGGRAAAAAAAAAAAGPNLFQSFHEGLMELFRVHAPVGAATATASGPDSSEAGANGSGSDSDDGDGDGDSSAVSESESESSSSHSESDHDRRSDSDASVSSGSGRRRHRRRRPRLSVQPELAEPAGGAGAIEPAITAAALATPIPSPVAAGLGPGSEPELSAAEQAQMAIFFATGFEDVHPLFKPPEEPPQPTVAQIAASAPLQTQTLPLLQQQSQPLPPPQQQAGQRRRQHRHADVGPQQSASSIAAPAAGIRSGWPCAAPSLAPALPPSSACSFLSPALWRNAATAEACGSGSGSGDRTQGDDPTCFLPSLRPVDDEQRRGHDSDSHTSDGMDADADAGSSPSPSSFLARLGPCASLSSLQSLVDVLLFHTRFPTYALHESVHRCLLAPLQQRFLDSNREFMHAVMVRCGLNHVRDTTPHTAGKGCTASPHGVLACASYAVVCSTVLCG